MAATKIEWADAVWNPVTGCRKVSPGCAHCYAERMASRLAGRYGYPADDPFRVTMHRDTLNEPLRWKKPRRIFVCSMGDLFHTDVPDAYILDVWRIMGECPQHTFLVLTKRPTRLAAWLSRWADTEEDDYTPKLARGPEAVRKAHKSRRALLFADMIESWGEPPDGCAYPTYDWMEGMRTWPVVLENVWLGVSVENQDAADERIPKLLEIPAAVRFLSCEPLLGPVSYRWPQWTGPLRGIDWVIAGGESGPNARPCHPDWVRSLRDQCQASGVPFFFKQWGEWWPISQMPDGYLDRHSTPREPTVRDPEPSPSYPWKRHDFGMKRDGNAVHCCFRVGRKTAGRLIDGREWLQEPRQ